MGWTGMRLFAGVVLAAVCLGGCASQPLADADLSHGMSSGRSLTMDGPRLNRLERRVGLADDERLAWYDMRNDVQPSVEAGYAGPMVEFSSTVTFDRQSIHNGRVSDHYHQRTTRGRYQRGVR